MILGSLFETRVEAAREAERRSGTLTDEEFWIGTPFYNPTAAGVNVTQTSALKFSAVFACTRILAESVAFLPLITYRRLKPRGKERATEHPLYSVLHDIANPEMTAYKLRETLQGHLGTWGNAYAEIQINGSGDVAALWPLRPDRMEEIKRGTDGRLRYSYRLPDGTMKVFWQEFILHIKGLGFDGTFGYSPVGMMRQSIALGLATEEHGARFFGNGARPGGVLQHPGKLGPEAYARMKESWNETHQGLTNAQRVAILEEGVTYHQVGISPEDAQFLETRKFQVTEIARWYRIPPHMIADLERSTNNNIEHQGIEFVVNTLGPWLVNWEQEIHLNLLDTAERKKYFCEHLVDGLLRGDLQSRYQAYATGMQWGWLSHDDIRERENMNPLPDNQGQVHYMPLNMMPVEAILAEDSQNQEEGSQNQDGTRALLEFDRRNESATDKPDEIRARKAGTIRHRLAMRQVRVFKDMAARILRRERNDVVAQARKMLKAGKSVSKFEQWLVEFYSKHSAWCAEQALPSMQAYAELVSDAVAEEVSPTDELEENVERFVRAYADGFGSKEAARSQARLIELIRSMTDPEEILEALEERLADWVEARPAAIALEEAIQVNSAVAVMLYVALGIRKLMSVATGETSCPFCEDLDGRVIGIEDVFLHAGEVFQPPGADKPMEISADKQHTPWHGGCLPADSFVTPVGRISAVSKRWFDGDLIVIHTAGGNKLTCTPNHPVLTPYGWMAANLLNVGSDVISSRLGEGTRVVDEGCENIPARIENIAKTVFDDVKMTSVVVPSSTENFHGDGGGSKVAVVGTYRNLRDRFDASSGKHFTETGFVNRFNDAPLLTCPSGHALFFESLDPARGSAISSSGLAPSIIGGHSASTHFSGSAVTANFDPSFYQSKADGGPGEIELVRERILGLSGEVLVDKVINIDIVPFSGHVYNLETEDGFYIADGIVTHNCDCMVVSA